MIGIYMIENTINRKKYIGQSWDVEARWTSEKKGCCNSHLRNAFVKYGIANFEFRVLIEVLAPTQEKLNDLEEALIDILDTLDPNKGYNKRAGGASGGRLSEETKRKISKANTGREITETQRQKLREAGLGRRPTQATRQKMSIAKKDRALSKEHREALSKIQKGRIPSLESRAKMSKSQRERPRKPHSEETKQKMRESLKAHYQKKREENAI